MSAPKIDDPPLTIDVDLRVHLGDQIAIGPGKAQLLESIRRTGSISAAGREMGMSYKHAWLLVDSMNGCFKSALVEAVKGGKAGGGAWLTTLGLEVLECYRHMQALAADAIGPEVEKFKRRIQES
ncbi:MAG: LysR family transcriptional regulator [Betaproteobacteria bacterium]|jgi:molybdate transport system regulatory protein|nr:MAG: LysR family transcriptional regulator [Betaproteobacteria bacterium]